MSAARPYLLYTDQHASPVWARTVNELGVRAGGGRISEMYRDKPDGRTVHCGYVVGRRWFTVYRPVEKPC